MKGLEENTCGCNYEKKDELDGDTCKESSVDRVTRQHSILQLMFHKSLTTIFTSPPHNNISTGSHMPIITAYTK